MATSCCAGNQKDLAAAMQRHRFTTTQRLRTFLVMADDKTRNEAGNIRDALRVSQLDATELDTQLFEVIKAQLNNIFTYFKPQFLVKYSPEINAIIRSILWKYSVGSDASTIGQQLLDLKYMNTRSTCPDDLWMTRRQRLAHACLFVGLPWLDERKAQLKASTSSVPHSEHFWYAVQWISKAVRILSLLNFLVFLTRGRYQKLSERLLGIAAVFPHPVGSRQIGFEYLDRELLWHGFAEFLFFILPLINFRRMKNFFSRHLSLRSPATKEQRSERDFTECTVCGLWPFNPQQIGCKHIFCYYCIQSNYAADVRFTCPECGHGIAGADGIAPVVLETGS
ncbi:hypothetical protein CAPTEDRAFT_224482 [Capitella teleta]|uniref:Peroxisome biogenesis factor 2 n=1 Tax=Capitella teleta TaxID=283909 RepID=R7T466_CAPTE|nr:hypothetical protein CAPTEDRAFT_224482 [Capitella teleta]|eukprot:ELT87556.1 hypothetical protein CAPTEDRAFT_224482 [Capitella teleta]